MKLNKIWGYGQLFGFSGIEGPNRYYDDFILMTMKKKLEFRIEYKSHYIKFNFPFEGKISFKYVMSDFVVASINETEFKLTFLDSDTLVGVSPTLPIFKGEKKLTSYQFKGADIYQLDNHFLGVTYKKENNLYKFVIHNSFSFYEASAGSRYFMNNSDVDELITKYLKYYENMPKCKDKKYESLYYKALSINKVNVHTPEGQIKYMWTTPDRVPHRHMWMWDSAFHALAMSTYNPSLAEEVLFAMLSQMKPNGFIPHMANPTDFTDITQPCVMSYATYQVYKRSGNKEFLFRCLPYLTKYLEYDMNNRDENKNGLLEWYTDPLDTKCKCGESGLDNSPRFDFDQNMDCIDFSSYFALDTKYLSLIYKELGKNEESDKWNEIHQKVSSLINNLMWDEKDGTYYDRLFDGTLTHVLTHSSFLPMFVGISNKEQAKKLVSLLKNEDELWTNFPLASITQKNEEFGNDMWRGGVWLNLNYFVIQGLLNYGYKDEAKELRDITLDKVNKWYKKSGCIFEFYDPKDEISPFMCHRKGEPLKNPDYRKHVHSISDYNWSASFTILMIQDIYE